MIRGRGVGQTFKRTDGQKKPASVAATSPNPRYGVGIQLYFELLKMMGATAPIPSQWLGSWRECAGVAGRGGSRAQREAGAGMEKRRQEGRQIRSVVKGFGMARAGHARGVPAWHGPAACECASRPASGSMREFAHLRAGHSAKVFGRRASGGWGPGAGNCMSQTRAGVLYLTCFLITFPTLVVGLAQRQPRPDRTVARPRSRSRAERAGGLDPGRAPCTHAARMHVFGACAKRSACTPRAITKSTQTPWSATLR